MLVPKTIERRRLQQSGADADADHEAAASTCVYNKANDRKTAVVLPHGLNPAHFESWGRVWRGQHC